MAMRETLLGEFSNFLYQLGINPPSYEMWMHSDKCNHLRHAVRKEPAPSVTARVQRKRWHQMYMNGQTPYTCTFVHVGGHLCAFGTWNESEFKDHLKEKHYAVLHPDREYSGALSCVWLSEAGMHRCTRSFNDFNKWDDHTIMHMKWYMSRTAYEGQKKCFRCDRVHMEDDTEHVNGMLCAKFENLDTKEDTWLKRYYEAQGRR